MDEDLHSNHVNAENPLYHNPARAVDNGGGDGAMVEGMRFKPNRFVTIDNFRSVDRKTKRPVLHIPSFSTRNCHSDLFYQNQPAKPTFFLLFQDSFSSMFLLLLSFFLCFITNVFVNILIVLNLMFFKFFKLASIRIK